MHTTKEITLVEVGPRDGLQNEKTLIPTQLKLNFIRDLAASGLAVIEATSFVSPRWVPQMSDHRDIVQALNLNGTVRYPVLIPNIQGLNAALELGVRDIAVFTAASERFSQHNTNCSIQQSLERIAEICRRAQQHHLNIRGYISCVMGCPYDEPISANTVATIADQLLQLGVSEISLGDTIGTGTPLLTARLLETVQQVIPSQQLAVHFHDTYHRALDNIKVSLEHGITVIDSSAHGLGGCPYAPGASGNVATEAVLDLLSELGYTTSVDKNLIIKASQPLIEYITNHTPFDE